MWPLLVCIKLEALDKDFQKILQRDTGLLSQAASLFKSRQHKGIKWAGTLLDT